MNKNSTYDIFISYRRKGGFETAKHLFDLLSRDGYRVSFDIDSLRDGNFDDSIFKIIDGCKDFILIIDEHAFDRTLNGLERKDDWLRQELAYALKKNINVIPVLLNGFNGFPVQLPEDISEIARKNGPQYSSYYFDDFYKKLKLFIQSKPTSLICKVVKTIFSIATVLGIIIVCVLSFSHYKHPDSKTPTVETDSTTNCCVDNMEWTSGLGKAYYTGEINSDSLPNGKGKAYIIEGEHKGSYYEGAFHKGEFHGATSRYTTYEMDKNGNLIEYLFIGNFEKDHYKDGKLQVISGDENRIGEYFEGEFDAKGKPLKGKCFDKNGNFLLIKP